MPVQQACPPEFFLDSFVLGLLSPAEVEEWAGHVEQCNRCTAHMTNVSTVKDMITEALKNPGNAKKEREHPRVKSLIAEVSGWGRQEEKTGPSARKESTDFLTPPQEPGELGRLGNYRVLELLGTGGMGMVFKAEDLSLKRIVALKVMKPSLAATSDYRERFQREAQTAALVEHDNIVPIYQVGEDHGTPYLAMPLLNGQSLDELIKKSEKMDIKQIVKLGCQMAEGLKAAHERSLIHRDIKPANIWIEAAQGGRVKILDFGLARSVGDDASRLTLSGTVLGTPAYMAPEQANDQPTDHRCDLFSLGCILYQMCTGQLPFAGKTTMGILASLANHTPVSPEKLNPEVPRLLSDLIMKLLAKDPQQRISTAAEVVKVLRGMQESSSIHPSITPLARSIKRMPTLVATALVVLVLMVVCGGLYQIYYRTENGTLVVEVDKDADVRFQAGELRIHDAVGKLLYTLKPSEKNKTLPAGKYTVDVIGADGVKLETDKFEIVKNGEARVRVTVDRETGMAKKVPDTRQDAKVNAAELQAAEWVLSIGAKLSVSRNQAGRDITTIGDFSAGPHDRVYVRIENNDQLTDAGLANLKGFTKPLSLVIAYSPMTAAGLEHLKGIPSLKWLTISGVQVDDAGIKHLKTMTQLDELSLADTPLNDDQLEQLTSLTNLGGLFLGRTNISDAGAKHLKAFPKLRALELRKTRVTGAGLEPFKNSTQLAMLFLDDTQVTDAGLNHLRELRNLTVLDLGDSKLTAERLAALQKALPQCEIRHNVN